MTFRALFQTIRSWPTQALAAALLMVLPAAANAAGIAATATIQSTQLNSTTFHYELTLTNTGTTTIGTFWFAWIPGAGFMTATPVNVVSPANWTSMLTNNNGSIQYVTNTLLAPGASISGFAFDSTMTPAQLETGTGTDGLPNDVTFVYEDAPLVGPGFQIEPSVINPLPPSSAVSSVLPGGRSVQVGTTATVFANMLNGGSAALNNCKIVLPASAPAGLSLTYQATNPATNAPVGTPNTPVMLPANGSASFVLSFASMTALNAPGLALSFECDNVQSVVSIPGVNTVDLLFSATPITDIIAIAATATGDGIVTMPVNGAGAFAVASDNAGSAGSVTVTTDTGAATLPLTATLCQTNPANGMCLAAPAGTVTLSDTAGATPTFSVFVTANAAIPLNAATSRIFLRFKDAQGTSHGSTSVAVETS